MAKDELTEEPARQSEERQARIDATIDALADVVRTRRGEAQLAARRSIADSAVVVSAAALAVALVAVFAAGFYANYQQLVSINREVGALSAQNTEIDRRLTLVEQGLGAVRTDLASLGQEVSGLRGEVAEMRAEFRAELQATRAVMQDVLNAVRGPEAGDSEGSGP